MELRKGIADQLAQQILAIAARAKTEEDVRIGVERVLHPICVELGVSPAQYEHGSRYGGGREDAVHGDVIVEYEAPRKFRARRGFLESVDQVIGYLNDTAPAGKHREGALRRLAGVVLDGFHIGFVHYRGSAARGPNTKDGFVFDGPHPVSRDSMTTLLANLRALRRRPLTPEDLADEFGPQGQTAKIVVPIFYRRLVSPRPPQVETLFGEWQRIFGIVYGEDLGSASKDAEGLARLYGVESEAPLRPLLFAVHTYFCLVIKLIAREILSLQEGGFVQSFVTGLASQPSEEFERRFRNLEDGDYFRAVGVTNFLEGDFFGWYTTAWDEEMETALRRFVGGLADFEPTTAFLDPAGTRDLLKKLYQYLVPKKLRHDLGEYYTPDWLAERLITQVGYQGDPDIRLLDPACGSGTFLTLAIARARARFEDRGPHDREARVALARKILRNVVGFDLNPLAVIAARTNYLLALGDLVRHVRPIELPVYLCDSILTPRYAQEFFKMTAKGKPLELFNFKAQPTGAPHVTPAFTQAGPLGLVLDTSVGQFIFPEELTKKETVEKLAQLLEECIGRNDTGQDFLVRAEHEGLPTRTASRDILENLYTKLSQLHRENRNRIWARIIKNSFAPVFAGQFDLVVGNPPWVIWDNLPRSYRDRTKFLWERHGLFSLKGYAARLGKVDLSMLFTYACTENYLKDGGRLGFVITQTVFKAKAVGDGFRRFRLGSGKPVQVLHVDDLTELQPFEGATNRTAVVVLRKGHETRYPVPYSYWRKKPGERPAPDWTLDEVSTRVRLLKFQASPIQKAQPTSPWITARASIMVGLEKAIGPTHDYRAREGVNTGGLNGAYWLKILEPRPDDLLVVKNLHDVGKHKVKPLSPPVEPDLVFPLLRGRDVGRWHAQPSAHILLPQRGMAGIEETEIKERFPHTYSYLRDFEQEMLSRKDFKYYPKGCPFYTMRNVGDYTFAEHKVVWRYIATDFTCAVVSAPEKMVIPDCKLILVACRTREEAHYLCALLNSAVTRAIVRAYVVGTQISTHVLQHVRVAKFDPNSKLHCDLAGLSLEAHRLVQGADKSVLSRLEAEVDAKAAELWGISARELKMIRDFLDELI